MTEPPRPAGESASDPTAPFKPPSYTMPGEAPGAGSGEPAGQQPAPAQTSGGGSYSMPSEGPSGGGDYVPGPSSGAGYAPGPSSGAGYTPGPSSGPPASGAGAYTPPPTSGAGYAPPPSSGAGAYTPPPTSGAGYQPTSGAGGYQQPPQQYPSQNPGYAAPGGYAAQQQPGYGQPGYGQPGAAGYPQGVAYPGQPGYGAPPPGYANADDKTYSMVAHWGGLAGVVLGGGVLGWIGPLIAYSAKGNVSPTVRAHAVTSLNFHITWAIANVLSWVVVLVSCGILIFVPFITWVVPVIFSVIGGVKATNGEFYRYPMAINMIK